MAAVRKRTDKTSGVIMKNIIVTSLISSVMNTILLCVSASKGKYFFNKKNIVR